VPANTQQTTNGYRSDHCMAFLRPQVQLQATLSRLTARMHDIQVRREETRHKLLEARHLVEILLIDENDLTLAHEEVEADLVKLKAHEVRACAVRVPHYSPCVSFYQLRARLQAAMQSHAAAGVCRRAWRGWSPPSTSTTNTT